MLILCSFILLMQTAQPPAVVMKTLRTRFPGAEIQKWTKETENGVVLYDIEFTQQGRKLEADIRADGTVSNWEREVQLQDSPAAVRETIKTKFPGATVRTILAVTAVHNGKEELEGYEVVLARSDGDEFEITVAPDGTVLENKAP